MGEACHANNVHPGSCLPGLELTDRISNSYPWYALRVRTGGEFAALSVLQYRGFHPYCPIQKERRRYSDRMKTVEVPVFPGYLFCRFDAQKKVPILSSPGVQQIVGIGGSPIPIPEEQIRNIQRVIGAGGYATGYLKQGQRVRVTHGSLVGVEGILVSDLNGERLVVSIDLLTRSACLHIDKDSVCPA
jgi:transcriptional antiterminator NusG